MTPGELSASKVFPASKLRQVRGSDVSNLGNGGTCRSRRSRRSLVSLLSKRNVDVGFVSSSEIACGSSARAPISSWLSFNSSRLFILLSERITSPRWGGAGLPERQPGAVRRSFICLNKQRGEAAFAQTFHARKVWSPRNPPARSNCSEPTPDDPGGFPGQA